MRVKPYFPGNNDIVNHEMGIVLVNHAGSVVSQDTGRDAQALSNSLGLAVLAVNRPGTAGFLPSTAKRKRLSNPMGYVAETTAYGRAIDRLGNSLGLKKLVIAGRSAGGLGALALVRTEVISSAHSLFVAEPPGCKAMSKKEGVQAFKNYGVRQKELQADGLVSVPSRTGLPRAQVILRLGSIVKNVAYDKFHNSALWASDTAITLAGHIAEHQPEVATRMSFAEHSLVVDDQIYEEEIVSLAGLRKQGLPFAVDRIPRTSHASFDDRELFARLVAQQIPELMLPD